jgi:dolichyl-phosphate beta-glucosyltransferase
VTRGLRRWIGRFALVGTGVTVADISALVVLHRGLGWSLAAADVTAVVLASCLSFVAHRTLTFRNDPFVRWVQHPGAVVVVAVLAGAADVSFLLNVTGAGRPSLAALLAAKVLAIGVGAVIRAVSYRWLLLQRVRRTQQPDPGRGRAPGDVRLSVVVPAYGEAERIGDAVRRLRTGLRPAAGDGGVEIVVVDDGSPDDTIEAARATGANQAIRLPENQGKGAAVRTGMLAARGRTVAFTDADLAYSPDQVLNLLLEVEQGWDMVVGSRRHTGTTTLVRARRLREVGGRVINLFTTALLLGQYRDTQCGLKAFRSDVARVLFAQTRIDGFAFDIELFHLAERYDLSVLEVPVRIENSERSTVNVARDALKLVADLIRVRRWAKQGAYADTTHEVLLATGGDGKAR